MGQYHIIANLDKQEFLHPHDYGDGLKQREFGESRNGTLTALTILLATSNNRGGGDFPVYECNGRWGGDRIVIVGDYSEDIDCPTFTNLPAYQEWKKANGNREGGYYDFVQETFKRLKLNEDHPELVQREILRTDE